MARKLTAGGGALAALFVATGAVAENTPSDQNASVGNVEEIIVTAQRRSERLQDVPIAIQAITGESLERQGIRSATDAVLQVPGVSLQSSTPTQAIFQMRGMPQDAAVDGSVSVYIDDVPFGFPRDPFVPNVDTLDLERIEVLRGPQPSLYGLGSMGGTIRVITADPNTTAGFTGRAVVEGNTTAGGDDSYYYGGSLNVPLVDDKLAARVVVSDRHVGGWLDNPVRGITNFNDSDVFYLRAKLLYTPTDKLKIRLTFMRNQIQAPWISAWSSHKNSDIQDATGSASDPQAFQDTFTTTYAGFLSYDLGFATLENGLNYYEERQPAEYVIGLAPGITLDLPSRYFNHAVTNEFRLVSNGNTAFRWVAGVFYRDATWSDTSSGNIGILQFPLSTSAFESKSISPFGEASYGFWDDRVRVLAGGRYFRDPRTFLTLDGTGAVTDRVKTTFTSFNPRFNVSVKANKDLMFYVNAAKGFRSGYLNSTTTSAGLALSGITGVQVVAPDSVWTYEVGSKATVLDGTLAFDTALYYSKWKDLQSPVTSPLGLAFQINSGDATIRGVEESVTWRTPIPGLNTVASVSYSHGVYDRVTPQIASFFALKAGEDLQGAPKWNGHFMLDYDTPLGNTGLNLVGGATYAYTSSITDGFGTKDQNGNFEFTDPRSEVSLRAGIRKGLWQVTVFANNVANDQKSTNLISNNWQQPIPRTIGLRLEGGF
jgi:iron complex outermembrane receptor protein